MPHVPLQNGAGPLHVRPHSPQFRMSLFGLTQAPLQQVNPLRQVVVQTDPPPAPPVPAPPLPPAPCVVALPAAPDDPVVVLPPQAESATASPKKPSCFACRALPLGEPLRAANVHHGFTSEMRVAQLPSTTRVPPQLVSARYSSRVHV